MLVVDTHSLRLIYLLHLVHQVALQVILSANVKDIVGVERSTDQRVAGPDIIAVFDQHVRRGEDQVLPGLHIVPNDGDDAGVNLNSASDVGHDLFDGFALSGRRSFDRCFGGLLDGGLGLPALERRHACGQDRSRFHFFTLVNQDQAVFGREVVLAEFFPADQTQAPALFVRFQFYRAVYVGQDGRAFGYAGLEKLFHPGQTAGDIQTGDTAGVERPHGQLCAGLADALGGDNANGLAHLHCHARGGQPAVAGLAHTAATFTVQR